MSWEHTERQLREHVARLRVIVAANPRDACCYHYAPVDGDGKTSQATAVKAVNADLDMVIRHLDRVKASMDRTGVVTPDDLERVVYAMNFLAAVEWTAHPTWALRVGEHMRFAHTEMVAKGRAATKDNHGTPSDEDIVAKVDEFKPNRTHGQAVTAAAETLNVARSTIYRALNRLTPPA